MILKRLMLGTLLMVLGARACEAQLNPVQGHGAPSGVCTSPYMDVDTGFLWTCKTGLYVSANGVTPNSPASPLSSPGPVFNVKNYGAKGDTQLSANASLVSSGGHTTITCTDCNFTQADVGKTVSCSTSVFNTLLSAQSIASVTNSTTAITTGAGVNGTCTGIFRWGTVDDAAVSTALAAVNAAFSSIQLVGNLGVVSASPCLYFPAGTYTLLTVSLAIAPTAGARAGGCIIGDGAEVSRVVADTAYTPTIGIVNLNGNVARFFIKDLTFDGMNGQQAGSAALALNAGRSELQNLIVQRYSRGGISMQGTTIANNLYVVQNNNTGISCAPCTAEIRNSISSNNGNSPNLVIQNSTGPTGSQGFRWYGGIIDECGSSANGCTQVLNSTDVWLIGGGFFGTTSAPAIFVDGTSYVHINGGLAGVFFTDTNTSGAKILSGGVLEASDTRFIGTGTGNCINNAGTFINNGANSCESQFATITAASSSSTTATLTVNTQGANVSAVCGVGDTIQVQQVGVAGYNGYFRGKVTAVGTNTISYTTPGSNLAASSGGSMFCKGFVTYSGTLPYSTITPTPNTCYVTGAFAAGTLCNQFIDRAVNIYRIKASSTTTTACTVAPVVTISDGTNSATLTITTAQSSWDSSVDASTNVGNTIYTPRGGTLTVSTTAGTCTTSPTNFALTYTMQAVLDN